MAIINITDNYIGNLAGNRWHISGNNDNILTYQGNTSNIIGLHSTWEIVPNSVLYPNRQFTSMFYANLKQFIQPYIKVNFPSELNDENKQFVPRLSSSQNEISSTNSLIPDPTASRTYVIYDSAYQLYEQVPNLNATRFLTDYPITVYYGYPMVIPFVINNLNTPIVLGFLAGASLEFSDTLSTNQPAYYNYNDDEEAHIAIYGNDVDSVVLRSGATELARIPTRYKNNCIDNDTDIYLRWKNNHGGWESHLFSNIFTKEIDSEYIEIHNANGVQDSLGKTNEETLTIRATKLDALDFKKVLNLATSSEVYRFHRTGDDDIFNYSGNWEKVFATINSGVNSKNLRGTLEFDIVGQQLISN